MQPHSHQQQKDAKEMKGHGNIVQPTIGRLFEGDESRAVGGTNTGATVPDGLVGDGELAKVVANHIRLHKQSVEERARVTLTLISP